MKNKLIFTAAIVIFTVSVLQAQVNMDPGEADKFLLVENYRAALDACKSILASDTASQFVLFKTGLAYER